MNFHFSFTWFGTPIFDLNMQGFLASVLIAWLIVDVVISPALKLVAHMAKRRWDASVRKRQGARA